MSSEGPRDLLCQVKSLLESHLAGQKLVGAYGAEMVD